MDITQDITADLRMALDHLGVESPQDISIEATTNPNFGDYTSNLAMQLFPRIDTARWNSPRSLAESIAAQLPKYQVNIAGPGFINFTLSDSYFTTVVREILDSESVVKKHKTGTVVVEYSSPNIAKPFTIGHLRSTIIGDAIANLLQTVGFQVKRDNHLGDWGTQFGKLIVAIKELGAGGELATIERIRTAAQPVKELVALYVDFHTKAETDPALEEKAREWFGKLERGDAQALRLWQLCIDWSWQEFTKIYEELSVSFTENDGRGYGESYFEGKMQAIVNELEKYPEYFKVGENGAKLFFFPQDELPPLMILKKDGSTLYATRDLATDRFRLDKYKDPVILNEVGAEQELYFRQLFRIEELLGWVTPGQRVHIKHGHYRFKEGKMSTRKGNVIWLADVIAQAKDRASKLSVQAPEVSAAVAIGALKWNDLKRASHLDVTFDWDEILSMEGNSGPYLQYTAVRCKSILQKFNNQSETGNATEAYNFEPSERAVVRNLAYFSQILEHCVSSYELHHLCTYLHTLASSFNSFYNTSRILGEPDNEAKRIALTRAVLRVLDAGLGILGIQIPDKM